MRYRENRRTGDRVSEIGLGTAYLYEAGADEAVRALTRARELGINYFDLAAGDGAMFPMFGEAFAGVRDGVIYQIHFGADYSKGTYGWSLDLDTVKRSVDRQLRDLKTDYINYGFIHCQDELKDWETYRKNGVFDYLMSLKDEGVVRHVGLSSHTPSVILEILKTDVVDMLMFSINPAYEYNRGEYAFGAVDERAAVYAECEKRGVGISVMKPFSGGQLLDEKTSPFGVALTPYQCIRYALDRPGVLTVLPGAANTEEVERLAAYCDATDEETDYSVVGTFAPPEAEGKCVYCNHCAPCPMGIDIGLVNKYFDLAKIGDSLAADHYAKLGVTASSCVSCGHCDSRCPFSVAQSERMTEIAEYFGK